VSAAAAALGAGALDGAAADEDAYILAMVMVASGVATQPEAELEASPEAKVADEVLGEVMGAVMIEVSGDHDYV
jgi:hypothetical protein